VDAFPDAYVEVTSGAKPERVEPHTATFKLVSDEYLGDLIKAPGNLGARFAGHKLALHNLTYEATSDDFKKLTPPSLVKWAAEKRSMPLVPTSGWAFSLPAEKEADLSELSMYAGAKLKWTLVSRAKGSTPAALSPLASSGGGGGGGGGGGDGGGSGSAPGTLAWADVAPLPSPPAPPPAQGSMGVVVSATYRGRRVAVKVFKTALLAAGELERATALLQAEVDKMVRASEGGLNDGVVVPLGLVAGGAPPAWASALGPHASVCLADGSRLCGIMMKWEEGGTLHELLHAPTRAWGAGTAGRLQLCAQLASGLASLHAAGVIHGDVKGENVLLSDRGATPRPRFTDFGFAELRTASLSRASSAVTVGEKRGTWPYMAPEMLLDTEDGSPPAGVSRSGDVYALGTLCWEVLTGGTPWGGFTEQQRMMALLQGKPTTLGMPLTVPPLPVDTPPAVRELLGACLAGDRATRPRAATAAEVLHQAAQDMASGEFDIFLSHAWRRGGAQEPLTSEVYLRLLDAGYRVWLDTVEMGHDMVASVKGGIANSGCVVALLTERYGASRNCLFELRCARDAGKPVVACLADAVPGWFPAAGSELAALVGVGSRMPDLRAAAAVNWRADMTAAEREILTKAPGALPKVLQLVREVLGRAAPPVAPRVKPAAAAAGGGGIDGSGGGGGGGRSGGGDSGGGGSGGGVFDGDGGGADLLREARALKALGDFAAAEALLVRLRATHKAAYDAGDPAGMFAYRIAREELADVLFLAGEAGSEVKRADATSLYRELADSEKLCGRFVFLNVGPLHCTKTSIVFAALDYGITPASPSEVAIKFLRVKAQYDRELAQRIGADGNSIAAVVPINYCTAFTDAPGRGRGAGFTTAERRYLDARYGSRAPKTWYPFGKESDPLFLISMPRLDKNLHQVIETESLTEDWPMRAKEFFTQAVEAVEALHEAGVVHGDLKPRNFMTERPAPGAGGMRRLLIIDMDASCKLGDRVADDKLSTAYAPPEALLGISGGGGGRGGGGGGAGDTSECPTCRGLLPLFCNANNTGGIEATRAFDTWGLGATLFHLLARMPLFPADASDNMAEPKRDVPLLRGWGLEVLTDKAKRLPVGDVAEGVDKLLVQLLHHIPDERPKDAKAIFSHPYMTGYEFDVFISCACGFLAEAPPCCYNPPPPPPSPPPFLYLPLTDRANDDSEDHRYERWLAREFYKKLTGLKLKVFWDEKELAAGEAFRRDFIAKLSRSRVFVPLVSDSVLRPEKGRREWSQLDSASPLDNVLLEYRAAYELAGAVPPPPAGAPPVDAAVAAQAAAAVRIRKVLPVFVGPLVSSEGGVDERASFFSRSDKPPPPAAMCVDSVETVLGALFKDMGLPPPRQAVTVAEVYNWASGGHAGPAGGNQGAKFWDGEASFKEVCDMIGRAVAGAKNEALRLLGAGSPRREAAASCTCAAPGAVAP
jgi:serine/threonine protein kinase